MATEQPAARATSLSVTSVTVAPLVEAAAPRPSLRLHRNGTGQPEHVGKRYHLITARPRTIGVAL
ncbi:hypothetical protein ACIRPR_01585 [Streptomyces griseoflavus]|uniref:hypothetical protein n=1 Tax=Streptomyces griseoflavus TaxID=35619 RepID=UPI0037F5ECDF